MGDTAETYPGSPADTPHPPPPPPTTTTTTSDTNTTSDNTTRDTMKTSTVVDTTATVTTTPVSGTRRTDASSATDAPAIAPTGALSFARRARQAAQALRSKLPRRQPVNTVGTPLQPSNSQQDSTSATAATNAAVLCDIESPGVNNQGGIGHGTDATADTSLNTTTGPMDISVDFLPLTDTSLPHREGLIAPDLFGEGNADDGDDDTSEEMRAAREHSGVEAGGDQGWQGVPWARTAPYLSKDITVNLHNEILDFVEHFTLTPDEKQGVAQCIADMQRIVKDMWGTDTECKVFGSQASGLSLPSSDIDFVILNCPAKPVQALARIASRLRKDGLARNIQVISKARVPITKFQHKSSKIDVDVCVGVVGGPDSTVVVREFMDKLPELRPIALILKQFLRQRKLNEPFLGGLGSYGLILMIISHIQMHKANYPVKMKEKGRLGQILIDFFELYGKLFNYITTGIRIVDSHGYYNKMREGRLDEGSPLMLSIEDPQDSSNDVGRSCYKLYNVKKAFDHALLTLKAGPNSQSPTLLSTIINPALVPSRRFKPTPRPHHKRTFSSAFGDEDGNGIDTSTTTTTTRNNNGVTPPGTKTPADDKNQQIPFATFKKHRFEKSALLNKGSALTAKKQAKKKKQKAKAKKNGSTVLSRRERKKRAKNKD